MHRLHGDVVKKHVVHIFSHNNLMLLNPPVSTVYFIKVNFIDAYLASDCFARYIHRISLQRNDRFEIREKHTHIHSQTQ